jgi:hypothetical protein
MAHATIEHDFEAVAEQGSFGSRFLLSELLEWFRDRLTTRGGPASPLRPTRPVPGWWSGWELSAHRDCLKAWGVAAPPRITWA